MLLGYESFSGIQGPIVGMKRYLWATQYSVILRARNYRLQTHKMQVILISCKWEKYLLVNVCKLESFMSPKHLKIICSWSHQFASGRNRTSQTLQVNWKVNFEPWFWAKVYNRSAMLFHSWCICLPDNITLSCVSAPGFQWTAMS